MRIVSGMWILLAFGLLSASDLTAEDACITCHIEIDEDLDHPVMVNILDDIHLKKGLSCASCHGGDPEAYDDEDAAMWDVDSFRGEIERSEQPEICGKCHEDPNFMRQYSASIRTDQVARYWTSQHGIELKRNNNKVAVCTDCHNVHGIFEVDDPRSSVYPSNVPKTCSNCHSDADYMAEFNIPTDQFYKYRTSVHGQALYDEHDIGAPACNDCHGNHGALPPDLAHITDICGTCHINNNILFQESHLKNVFLKRNFGQCEVCHGNHGISRTSDEFLNWDKGAVCVQCHKDAGGAKDLANSFYSLIDSMKSQITLANNLVHEAERIGMEVSDLFFPLGEARKGLIQTRTSIHSFNQTFVETTAQAGFKESQIAIEGAQTALRESTSRRRGLFYFSLLITLLVVTLYFKIKDIEKRQSNRK